MILMGVFDVELREYLVERGHRDGLKFAFPNRGEKKDSYIGAKGLAKTRTRTRAKARARARD